MNPILSIVIANYNYGRFLEDAIRSVFLQDMGDKVELIICDAASTDNSVDIIKKYESKIAWWCSEKDGGQSAAFNKGFAHARGKYLTWLNADDVLVAGCLKRVIAEMERHPDCEWFTGNFFRFLESDKTIMQIGWGPHIYPKWMQTRRSPLVIFGPTTFFSKRIYEQVGRINETMHFCMDNDLWYRFVLSGVKQRRIRCFCWAFRMHEASKTAEFGDHRTSNESKVKGGQEVAAMYNRLKYKKSNVLASVVRLLRIGDGSFILGQLMRILMINKKFNIKSAVSVKKIQI